MDETTQETAALDDNGDGQANVAKIVGPPPYWSSVGIAIFRSDAWLRYVPEDVVRWRDPEHRAALTARAREYASHLPGRRA